MTEFRMPSLGADMKEGRLVEWKVKLGDQVKRGDIIAEVETAKGVIEIEVFTDGVIEQILVQRGENVPVGTVLATIQGNGEQGRELREEALPEPVFKYKACLIAAHREEPAAEPPPAVVTAAGKRLRISPRARKLLAELDVELSTVQGTGQGGAITGIDIERAAAAEKAAAQSVPSTPGAAMRQAIATAMARSNREIPHYYLASRIDMSNTLRWLEAENKKRSIKERVLPVVPLIKATALALAKVPELNGYWLDNRQQPEEAVHIGFVISLRQGGLVAPAIHHANLKSLPELMETLSDLITRTRSGHLRSSELTDATVTITNLGDLGVEVVHGVIYPPQVALVGFGKILEQPWAKDGMLGIRPILTATLAADHRATDGHRGAQFLEALNHHLQKPEEL
ncbi:dihydrolipoamide acetyltransferase family protein [Desulfotalea psychrophila]|uniref:Dihydrolipoamide acetyltransferase component of pyruvate dehydrogenase complex n=1 Tax=Desulfotalea psychrophila (strain LSv54 / DSM 12343) TaxID=177439 RepID=Q6ALF2_DESPS|nr:dihydrolipoamide acetyltransferase family protein [Desulfotalea psychrophila]CAG36823.1 probable dihydrolipoamide acetyltransferase, component E2 of pyruvate dehydrogenase [Desulfotalea psychrophila LSv54]